MTYLTAFKKVFFYNDSVTLKSYNNLIGRVCIKHAMLWGLELKYSFVGSEPYIKTGTVQ